MDQLAYIIVCLLDILFVAMLILSCIVDTKIREIPDKAWIVIVIAAITKSITASVANGSLMPIKAMVLGAIVMSPIIILAIAGTDESRIGGGDYKLLTAIGLYTTFPNIIIGLFLILTAFLVHIVIAKQDCKKKGKEWSKRLPFAPSVAFGSIAFTVAGYIF